MDLSRHITVTVDRDELREGVDGVLDAIERATYRALDGAAERVAERARKQHWYRNRTGDLEGSTQALGVVGDVWSDSAESIAFAGMPYARFVDARSPILSPAYEAVASAIQNDALSLFAGALR